MKILITRQIPEAGLKLLKSKGFKLAIHRGKAPISRQTLLQKVKDCDAIICLLTEKIDKEVIDKMSNCKIISNYAVGFNNIDIEYARKKGIIVTNTPDVLTDSTADLTFALILACSRRIAEGYEMMKSNAYTGWQPELLLGKELKNKILGIIGAGRIGSAVACRAKAFGCKIIYYSEFQNIKLEKETGAKKVSLNSLLKRSDIVSIHLPLNVKTKLLLDSKKFSLIKNNAVFINTARGEIIDEKALIKKLKKNKSFSAGLDVFHNEPFINKELLNLKNLLVLPHIGSATREARDAMSVLAAKNVIAVLSEKRALTPLY